MELAARYVPGSDGIRIGGDWYDAVPLPSGRLMIAIGDVVGHGIRAATWMGRLRTLVQFCALDGLDPAAVLTRLNDYCFSASGSDMATAIVGIFDPARDVLEFASAGHPPLLVRRADGAIDVVWEGRGPPLCATERAVFTTAEIALGPGDLLVLYTDGLVERRGEQFDTGIDRLCDTLRGEPDEPRGDRRPAHDDAARPVASGRRRRGAAPRADAGGRRPRSRARRRRRGCSSGCAGRCGAGSTPPGMAPDAASEVIVAVNEIAGNAIEHAYGPGRRRVRGARPPRRRRRHRSRSATPGTGGSPCPATAAAASGSPPT